MQAVIIEDANGPESVQYGEAPTPEPAAGEARVKLHASALNRRDYWITKGMYPRPQLPCIPGSDGAGVVDVLGEGTPEGLAGREVIIYPALDWGPVERAPSKKFRVLGMPEPGTMAEYICVPASSLVDKPSHLSWEEAAALPLAGLTAWRSVVTQAEIEPGQKMLVTGAGGGVATMALQWGALHGADVYVTSGSEEKIAAARSIGAVDGANYRDEDCFKTLKERSGGFDVIIDSAGGDGLNAVLDTLSPGGRYVFFGATLGMPKQGLSMAKLFFRQVRIQGTTMGSPQEFSDMVAFATEKHMRPVIDRVLQLEQAREGFWLMESFGQTGKIVLRHAL